MAVNAHRCKEQELVTAQSSQGLTSPYTERKIDQNDTMVAKVTVRVLANSTMLEEQQRKHLNANVDLTSRANDSPTTGPFPPDTWLHIDYYSQYWNLTTSQSKALMELRDRLVDVTNLGLNRPMNVVRYLRAQAYSPSLAEVMFRNMLAWRETNRVDTFIMTKDYTPPQDLVDRYPGAILKGNDLRGDPIFVNRTGVTDIVGLLETYGQEAMIQYEIYRRESGMISSEHVDLDVLPPCINPAGSGQVVDGMWLVSKAQ